jgi:hypothetical protein
MGIAQNRGKRGGAEIGTWCFLQCSNDFICRGRLAALTVAQPGTTPGRHTACGACPDIGWGRFGQNPRAHHPHRLASADRPGLARWCAGGDLHQQGGQRNAHPPGRHAAGQRPRHVDRHLSRPVQPLPARAPQAGRSAPGVPDSGHPDQLSAIKRLCKQFNVDDERFPPKQLQWFIAGNKEDGLRPADVQARDEETRKKVEIYALYEDQCQREGVVDFRRADAAQL